MEYLEKFMQLNNKNNERENTSNNRIHIRTCIIDDHRNVVRCMGIQRCILVTYQIVT